MWVRFLRDFDWSPKTKRVMIAYAAGMELRVPHACAQLALAAGAAERITPPRGAPVVDDSTDDESLAQS